MVLIFTHFCPKLLAKTPVSPESPVSPVSPSASLSFWGLFFFLVFLDPLQESSLQVKILSVCQSVCLYVITSYYFPYFQTLS